ncbi:GGDEF domain-containing protein [Lysinibacillus sp. CD3-6]|uniref:diguanylate cyclase domain-containing protein n=1 Tax=Lysinibacillus sp. CD3-6 TaxID=2892541 RepID=UPI0011205691|nr:diguanylate cyclase [Lysinibacillus sp. CD3-6]UED79521.1 GGDEF domain-containing protein [Lysinibacillus sp. CD3-6]
MRTAIKWNKAIFVYGVLLILLLQLPAYFLLHQDSESLLLYIFLILLVIITLWRGTVTGLISSLLFIFISGSTLLYIGMTGSIALLSTAFSMQLFLAYGVVLLLLVLCAGKIHELLIAQEKYMKNLQQDVKNFVAIDVETGFDNESRMRVIVNEEMRRADRHQHTFVFIMLKLENYEKFKKLYGFKEAQYLWRQLAEKLQQSVRQTDKKFRYRENYLGILLIDTSEQYIDIIYEKLDQALKNHQLLNKRWVTLSYKTSYFTYTPQMDQSFDDLLAEMEREMKTSAL